nr:MAG TPA: chromosome partitioning protein [Caudoviricetes sp.]
MAGKKFDITKFAATLPEAVPESGTTREIAVTDIFDNPLNFYPKPDKGNLGELMDSIRANGMLEPPTVVPAGNGKYRLISGHSRMEAVRALSIYLDRQIADRFQTVMCRVLPSMTPEQEECAVIEANRQRVKSPALLAEEAERLTKIYIKRREAGEELPGRIRDRVAEAMQVKKTKLANLSAIKNGIKVPGIIARWEAGELPEAAALEIARMDIDTQYRFLDWMIDNGGPWTIKNVQEFVRSRTAAAPAERPATKLPTLFSVDLCAPEWLPLDAEHWPTEGALVVLSYETGLGGSSYLVARCAGGADEAYPFISTDAGTTVDDIVECRCDRWMPLAECRRGGEGA